MAPSSSKYVARPKLMAFAIGTFGFSSLFAAPISGQGTWESTLQARDLDGNKSTVEAYYDTALGITWLANANLAKTHYLPGTKNGISLAPPPTNPTPSASLPSSDGVPTVTVSFGETPDYTKAVDGLMNSTQATTWAQAINIHGFDGWRLPLNKIANDAPLTEMAHLYTSTLGNSLLMKSMQQVGSSGSSGITQYQSVTIAIREGGRGNTGPFLNIQSSQANGDVFWFATPQGFDADFYGSSFNWGTGYTATKSSTPKALAWLVHDGDIGSIMAVPEPKTLPLMLLGLVALTLNRLCAQRSSACLVKRDA